MSKGGYLLMYNPFSLEGKTILITGASSGIGRATAIECSKMGANVILSARDENRLRQTLNMMDYTERHKIIPADLSKKIDVDSMIKSIDGCVQGIVNCAGMVITKPIKFIKEDDIDSIMSVNYKSPVMLTIGLLKKKLVCPGASIVFISSIGGPFVTSMANGLYAGSKGAVHGMVKSLALELATRNIRVNCINPGMVHSNLMSSGIVSEEQLKADLKNYPLGRYGEPIDIARGIIFLLSDASQWITGINLVIDGGCLLR